MTVKFGFAVFEFLLPSTDNVHLKDRDLALCVSTTLTLCQQNPIMVPTAMFPAPGMTPFSFASDCSKDGHVTVLAIRGKGSTSWRFWKDFPT